MYKTLGGYNWSDLFISVTTNKTEPIKTAQMPNLISEHLMTTTVNVNAEDQPFEIPDKSIFESAKELQSSFHGLKAVCIGCGYF